MRTAICVGNSPAVPTDQLARPWRRLPDPEKSAMALRRAIEVADRLRELPLVEAAVIQAKLQANEPKAPQWVPDGFAQGYAGLTLLWAQLDRCFPNEGWDEVAHDHLEIAAEGAATRQWLTPGAFSGIGGLAFVASYLSRSGTHYSQLLATLDKVLIPSLASRIAYLNGLRAGVPTNTFDVISGLSGAVPYLLSRRESAEVENTLIDLIRSLIDLSQDEDGLPRWHSPPHFSKPAEDYMLQQYPSGYLNCGLAHGVPGLLGALALAHLSGIRGVGLEEAIDRLATWLITHRFDDEWGLNWPAGVGLRPPGDPTGRICPVDASTRAQAGWCYGSPGIARVLYFAGQCLERQEYCDLAVQAIEAVLRRPLAARRIESPTFCHGVAGLLQIVLRFAHDTGSTVIQDGAVALTEQLLGLHEPESLLGFRSVEFAGKRVDQPGLLDGAPGVALVLLGVACDMEPAWDRIFLLS
jgi:lantibiotic biosynthesis protein